MSCYNYVLVRLELLNPSGVSNRPRPAGVDKEDKNSDLCLGNLQIDDMGVSFTNELDNLQVSNTWWSIANLDKTKHYQT